MNSDSTILRRIHINQNMDLLLREMLFHRMYDSDEDLPCVKVWQLDEEVGEGPLPKDSYVDS